MQLPLELLPTTSPGTRRALAAETLAINRLIGGELADSTTLEFLRHHLDGSLDSRLESFFRLRFDGFWNPDEIDEIARGGSRKLEQHWRLGLDRQARRDRRRHGAAGRPTAAESIRKERNFAEIWDDLPVGDFDIGGRGHDYTRGMAYFQAARAFGIESLLPLLSSPGGGGLVLDVLGGDGYILRIRRACAKRTEGKLWILPTTTACLAALEDAEAPGERRAAVLSGADGALAFALAPGAAAEDPARARLLVIDHEGVSVSRIFELERSRLALLEERGAAARVPSEAPACEPGTLLEVLGDALAATPTAGWPEVFTNDLSPHMFRAAGVWGLPTREDARSLSRTFRPRGLDGVLFAYGTHHVPEFATAIEESLKVLRPGGRIVVHDFLDEGKVGRWFHEVVDRHSRTGHDFAHLGPIEVATYLYLAGFRDVELYEMEDPFIFAPPAEDATSARDIACTYLLGMYGMTEGLGGRREAFEALVRDILSYPEIGSHPVFDDDFVYIPRRAVIATARRPEDGDGGLAASDRRLAGRLSALFAADPGDLAKHLDLPPAVEGVWFPADGSRWGVSPAVQERWRVSALARATG